MKIRRALLSVSDKTGLVELADALVRSGVECVASGGTERTLKEAGLSVTPVESLTGNSEAFGGRMKTLSFEIASGILFRRSDPVDQRTVESLGIRPIDLVVVNFYPFEETTRRANSTRAEWIENIDIGGPTLVRAAAKNAPDVIVLTHPEQYSRFVSALKTNALSEELIRGFALEAFERTALYDRTIVEALGTSRVSLRYGENPHQSGYLIEAPSSPLAWSEPTGMGSLSYNNILDISRGYELLREIRALNPQCKSAVIVKHGNPCGAAVESMPGGGSLVEVLSRAWEGDPVSAFGGVVLLSHVPDDEVRDFLSEYFIEAVVAPELELDLVQRFWPKKKKLKAVRVTHWDSAKTAQHFEVVGGTLVQDRDQGVHERIVGATDEPWNSKDDSLAHFGITIVRALLSNAIAIVREVGGIYQLIGTGQGQPNRIDALETLALQRARKVAGDGSGGLDQALVVSDAFFPFEDAMEALGESGVRKVVQPGGSIHDREVIEAANRRRITMAFTGVRHFKHF